MRGLNKGMEMANIFTLENQRQLAITAENATRAAAAAEARYNENMDRLTDNFQKQLAWKDGDIARMQARLERLEERAAKTIELSEELQTMAHERQLQMIKVVEGEDRKTKAIEFGLKMIGPALVKRYAPALGLASGGGAPPAAGATSSAPAPSARNFNENEDAAIYALMRLLFEKPELLERVEASLKGTDAEVLFARMAQVLIEEHIKRSAAAQAAEQQQQPPPHANGATNAPTNGVPS
jgi:hypothetical protein